MCHSFCIQLVQLATAHSGVAAESSQSHNCKQWANHEKFQKPLRQGQKLTR